ncbi:MAG: hypothetical protein V7K27_13835 [Nostoc sp.]|uniref:hypothetical protein n=1 Tax=Nostoc sp. TaxID=1180 RepID=UPI002FF6EA9A
MRQQYTVFIPLSGWHEYKVSSANRIHVWRDRFSVIAAVKDKSTFSDFDYWVSVIALVMTKRSLLWKVTFPNADVFCIRF